MSNNLKHFNEFQQIIKNYSVSKDTKKILENIKLTLLLAPSSSGRNTIIEELLKTGEYHFIISDTTRLPRKNNGVMERNGVEYWFKSEEEVLRGLKAGKYLEAEIIHGQQVSGISIRELQRAKAEGKIAITDIDIGGFKNILEAKPDTKTILILPPNFEEWQKRLFKRGVMETAELKRRLKTACRIFEAAMKEIAVRYVINDNLEEAACQVHSISILNQTDDARQHKGRLLANQLLVDTTEYLKKLN